MKRLFLLSLLLWLLATTVQAQTPAKPARSSVKTLRSPQGTAQSTVSNQFIDGNSVKAHTSNKMYMFYNTAISSTGYEWIKSSGRHAIFSGGPWIAAQYGGVPADIRTAAIQNSGISGAEFQPGKILSPGVAANPNDAGFVIYKIKQGDNALNNPDYANWPVADGAPVTATGQPLLTGSQSLWAVSNDLLPLSQRAYDTPPLGCEIQQYLYAYSYPSATGVLETALNQTVFVRFRIINKSDTLWKAAHLGFWADPDLGNSLDDLIGCDSVRGLGYCYNGDNDDETGYGIAPPAVGYIFLGGSPNLSMRAFVRFDNLPAPPPNDPNNASGVYNSLQGLTQNGGQVPGTSSGSRFMFPGDPETQQGTPLVEQPAVQGDKRFVLSTGAIDINPNDTVNLVYAVTIARGTSNRNSVTVLKQYADSLRSWYNRTPLINSVSPNNALRGQQLSVTMTGQNVQFRSFPNDTNAFATVRLRKGSLSLEPVSATATSNTTLVANFTIPPDAPLGAWDVSVDQSGSLETVTLANGFTITAPPADSASLAFISPTVATQGQTLPIIIGGRNTHFTAQDSGGTAPRVYLAKVTLRIEVTGISVANDTLLSGTLNVPEQARIGAWHVFVDQRAGFGDVELYDGFAINSLVTANTTAITSVGNTAATQGASITVPITGQNTAFQTNPALRVWISKGNLVVNASSFVTASLTSMNATFTVPANAPAGVWNVSVEQPAPFGVVTIYHALQLNAANISTPINPVEKLVSYRLSQNYPNPFNPVTTIGYQLSGASEVSLKVFDMLGREVAALVSGKQSAGNYEVRFDASRLATGIYFYRLTATGVTGNFAETKKMVLVK